MAVVVSVRAERSVPLPCAAGEAFAFVSDIEASARLFPLLEEIERAPSLDLGAAQAWRSGLRPQGPPPFAVSPQYVCRYEVWPDTPLILRWTPVPDVGTAAVTGQCSVQPDGSGCIVELQIAMQTQVGAPRLMRLAVQAAVQLGFDAAVSAYVRRIAEHLAPGA